MIIRSRAIGNFSLLIGEFDGERNLEANSNIGIPYIGDMSDAKNFDVRFGEIVRALSQVKNIDLLNRIGDMIEESRQDQIVGYEADGTPITPSLLLESVEEAEEDYKAGRTYSTSEIVEHFNSREENA